MGLVQSLFSVQGVLTLIVLGGVLFGVGTYTSTTTTPGLPAPATVSKSGSSASGSKKNKKKKASSGLAPTSETETGVSDVPQHKPVVVAFPPVVPGGFDGPATSTATSVVDEDTGAPLKKAKKKKTKKPAAPVEANKQTTKPTATVSAPGPSRSIESDETWTRVETRRKGAPNAKASLSAPVPDRSASETGVTTSVTGPSSPNTEDEKEVSSTSQTQQRPLAERMLPKPRKTGVDDMLETSDYPTVSRVMRVQPSADEKPADGFSWGDYEDVRPGDDADREDDGGGWGVIKSKKSNNKARPAPAAANVPANIGSSDTKKARQNAAKRDAQKAAKAEAEADRLARLAQHKRELERAKIQEQYASKGKNNKVSGGMTATVSDTGKLVWE